MSQPALFKRLSNSARESISLVKLGAAYIEMSVQPDRTVVQLWFRGLPSPFDDAEFFSLLELLRVQLLVGAFSTAGFSVLSYSLEDVKRLWLFVLEDYGMGSMPVCNFCNGHLEWKIHR